MWAANRLSRKRSGRSWPAEKLREAKRKSWVDMWIGFDENFAGGGNLDIVRKMEVRKMP